jgi:hypothetical protein
LHPDQAGRKKNLPGIVIRIALRQKENYLYWKLSINGSLESHKTKIKNMDTRKIEELKNSLSEIRETAEVLERKLEKFMTEEDSEKREAMRKLIESAINLLQFEFKRTMLLGTGELKDYFDDL